MSLMRNKISPSVPVQSKRFFVSLILLSLLSTQAFAQAKRPITFQDFDSWRSLQGA